MIRSTALLLFLSLIVHPTVLPASSHTDAALALIEYPWQDLSYEIVFLGPRKGYRAMTIPKSRKIEIYLRPGEDPERVAHDIAHEIGHAIDLTFNTRETREEWRRIRGIEPTATWFGCNRCSDYNTPSGDFAETFAFLLLGPDHFAGRIAAPPAPDEIPVLLSFFQRLTGGAFPGDLSPTEGNVQSAVLSD